MRTDLAEIRMQLWSWHPAEFSLLEGHVDHSKSPYLETVPGISEAYQRVWDHVGEDQVIWCWTSDDAQPEPGKVKWILNVPDTEILALIDDYAWERILKLRSHPPRRLYWEWRDLAEERFPTDSDARWKFIQQQHEEYWSAQPTSGDWWDHVLVPDTNRNSTSAILRHPVQEAWVISREQSGKRRR